MYLLKSYIIAYWNSKFKWAFLWFTGWGHFPVSVTTWYRDQLKHHFQLKIQLISKTFYWLKCGWDELNFHLKMMFQLVPVSGGNRNVPGGSGRHMSLPSEIFTRFISFKSKPNDLISRINFENMSETLYSLKLLKLLWKNKTQ